MSRGAAMFLIAAPSASDKWSARALLGSASTLSFTLSTIRRLAGAIRGFQQLLRRPRKWIRTINHLLPTRLDEGRR